MANWSRKESKRIGKARQLLKPGIQEASGLWADFGCGDGIFTAALAELIGPAATILAIDKDPGAIHDLKSHFADSYPSIQLNTLQADFSRSIEIPLLNGLISANALHFVDERERIFADFFQYLRSDGILIIVEYDTNKGNTWVPYPFDRRQFRAYAREAGFTDIHIQATIPSRFLGAMYAGFGRKP